MESRLALLEREADLERRMAKLEGGGGGSSSSSSYDTTSYVTSRNNGRSSWYGDVYSTGYYGGYGGYGYGGHGYGGYGYGYGGYPSRLYGGYNYNDGYGYHGPPGNYQTSWRAYQEDYARGIHGYYRDPYRSQYMNRWYYN